MSNIYESEVKDRIYAGVDNFKALPYLDACDIAWLKFCTLTAKHQADILADERWTLGICKILTEGDPMSIRHYLSQHLALYYMTHDDIQDDFERLAFDVEQDRKDAVVDAKIRERKEAMA